MGNCKSKKSTKSLRISSEKERNSLTKMNKDKEMHGTKGTSKKVVPFTKGEMTSFGFKKKISSQLPAPVTLINGDLCRENRRTNKSSQKNLSEGYQSGSSIESLCHMSFKSTPKMIRKRETLDCRPPQKKERGRDPNDEAGPDFGSDLVRPVESWAPVNRFGFRQHAPTKAGGSNGRNGRKTFFSGQDPEDSDPQDIFSNKSDFFSTGPRSGGTQNAVRPCSKTPESNPAGSGLRNSKSFLPLGTQPKRFTLQTSHLPKPQFAVKVTDAKTVKTATNYYRRGGGRGEVANVDSGLKSANSALSKSIGKLDTSPGMGVRRRLPTSKGKKLEMKVVGNKFELLKESGENDGNAVTEISLIKLPPISSLRGGTAVISTGLVEERTCQYLKKISQSYVSRAVDSSEIGKKVSPGSTAITCHTGSREWSRPDEGLGTESEEEKLFKDSKGSEKFLTTPSFVEADEVMLLGEAMAEDDSWTTTERPGGASPRKKGKESFFGTAYEVSNEDPNFEFEFPNGARVQPPKEEDFSFPSDSILEPFSSESESLDDKAENKDNDQEKNLYLEELDKDLEDLGIDMKAGTDLNEICERDTDIEDELDANPADGEDNRRPKNSLGTPTPTPTSNSISLSDGDGRDFLIDDEIADQPQLCFSEQFLDTTYKNEEKPELCTGTRSGLNMADHREKNETENGDETCASTGTSREGIRPNSAEGSLSPCDSIASDDLMLDFETSSFEECGGRSNAKCFKGTVVGARNDDSQSKSASCQPSRSRADSAKLSEEQTGSGRNTPATAKFSQAVSSPLRPFRCRQPADGDSVEIDKMTYELVFQDVVSVKAMLMNLKCLLSESDERMEQEARTRSVDGDPETELADLRRQVLFLQQQLEEREKTVRVLQLKVNETADCVFGGEPTGSRNAATQTGLDKFQQEFQRFGIFQTTPVV